jgi:hypothetical protein
MTPDDLESIEASIAAINRLPPGRTTRPEKEAACDCWWRSERQGQGGGYPTSQHHDL